MSLQNSTRKAKLKKSSKKFMSKGYSRYKELFPQKHSAAYFIISLAIAVILWMNVESREELERTYKVDIMFDNIPENFVFRDFPTSFELHLQGNREEFLAFEEFYEEMGVNYHLDVSEIQTGTNLYLIDTKEKNLFSNRRALRGLNILTSNPSHIVILAEEMFFAPRKNN